MTANLRSLLYTLVPRWATPTPRRPQGRPAAGWEGYGAGAQEAEAEVFNLTILS